MKLFKFIRESLANIGFKATYKPHNTITATPDTVKQVDYKKQIESVRKAFAEQEQEMHIRGMKAHSPACKDNWTCRAEPCFKVTPDRIVKHKKSCVHHYGIVISEPMCNPHCEDKRFKKDTEKMKDKDFRI